MSRDIYLIGASAAHKQVKKYLTQIYAAKSSEDIGRIAGQALNELKEKGDFLTHNPYGRSKTWSEGFWEGFVERAEEFKKSDKKK